MAQKYWSKLEDDGDITTPEVGPAGTKDGSPTYVACKFNNGIYVDVDAEGYHFPNNPTVITGATKGTVEFWIKPDFDLVNGIPATARHHMFVEYNPAGSAWLLFYIHGGEGIRIYRADDSNVAVDAVDSTTDWTAGDLVHLAFVWDAAAGFDSTKTLAVYVNGVQTASSTTALGTFTDDTSDIHVGWWPTVADKEMDSALDNLKIHDVAKTDFSDKDTEDTSPVVGPPGIKTINDLAIASIKTVNDVAIGSVKTIQDAS